MTLYRDAEKKPPQPPQPQLNKESSLKPIAI